MIQLLFAGNRLNELTSSITLLPALQVLDLTGNRLQFLPSSVGSLTALRTLRLGGNPLKELPRTLGSLENVLQDLIFDRNGLKWPFTSQVVNGKTADLLRFLSTFHRGEKDHVRPQPVCVALDLNSW